MLSDICSVMPFQIQMNQWMKAGLIFILACGWIGCLDPNDSLNGAGKLFEGEGNMGGSTVVGGELFNSLSTMDRLQQATVTVDVPDGQGSGVFIGPYTLATNHHVIEGFIQVTIVTSDGRSWPGRVIKEKSVWDLAIIEVQHSGSYPVMEMASSEPQVSDEIWVAGAPLGLSGTVSNGILSAKREADFLETLGTRCPVYQISASISPGSSGGPVMNRKGQLIGLACASREDGQSLNFAIPVKYVHSLSSN